MHTHKYMKKYRQIFGAHAKTNNLRPKQTYKSGKLNLAIFEENNCIVFYLKFKGENNWLSSHMLVTSVDTRGHRQSQSVNSPTARFSEKRECHLGRAAARRLCNCSNATGGPVHRRPLSPPDLLPSTPAVVHTHG